MSPRGSNLPNFRALQLDFTAHLRNPESNPMPSGLEARRVQIYVDLIFNNIESFLSSSFPIAKSLFTPERWRNIVRKFVEKHGSESPYFLEIPQEFLTFVSQQIDVEPYLLELCHYEWMELALDVAENEIVNSKKDGDLLAEIPVLSPYLWRLIYKWPVHQIGPAHKPKEAPPEPTYLLAYRDDKLRVKFSGSNPLTHRLLELIEEGMTGAAAIAQIVEELGTISVARGTSAQEAESQINSKGAATLRELKSQDIILGTVIL